MLLSLAGAIGCGTVGRVYEYEEALYLSLDGSATLFVNGSVPALVALRGLDLDLNPRARLDRGKVRNAYESSVTHVTRVGSSRRSGRRFVHLRIEVDDVRRLGEVAPLSWSTYSFVEQDDAFVFRQRVGPPAGVRIGAVGWTGKELTAFRLHLPSRIFYHNAPSGQVARGNILEWEQPLSDRLAGEPVSIEVHLDTESILYRTLWLFGAMILLVAALFALVIAWIIRKGRRAPPPVATGGGS
ncbi:MAG TPA: hypothetical protein VNK41_12015 [Vicinamibacterales bacterium]|nr:hypothetical protein [Vicinamibacterales bacterium]